MTDTGLKRIHTLEEGMKILEVGEEAWIEGPRLSEFQIDPDQSSYYLAVGWIPLRMYPGFLEFGVYYNMLGLMRLHEDDIKA